MKDILERAVETTIKKRIDEGSLSLGKGTIKIFHQELDFKFCFANEILEQDENIKLIYECPAQKLGCPEAMSIDIVLLYKEEIYPIEVKYNDSETELEKDIRKTQKLIKDSNNSMMNTGYCLLVDGRSEALKKSGQSCGGEWKLVKEDEKYLGFNYLLVEIQKQ